MLGQPVVVDVDKGRIYGPFKSWEDAEWFSEQWSYGMWGVVNLDSPNFAVPRHSTPMSRYDEKYQHIQFSENPPYERG